MKAASAPSAPRSVLLADDHQLVRDALRRVLTRAADTVVVAEASSAEEAIEKAERAQPEVAILEVSMPGGGLNAVRAIRRKSRGTRIIMLTGDPDATSLRACLAAGALGYLAKGCGVDEVITAVDAIYGGSMVINVPAIIGEELWGPGMSVPEQDPEVLDKLTTRERQVFTLIGKGLSNQEMASELGIAVKTVESHRANVAEKVGVSRREKLVGLAFKLGLVH